MADKRMQCQTQVHTHTYTQTRTLQWLYFKREKETDLNESSPAGPFPWTKRRLCLSYTHTDISHHYTLFSRQTTFLKLMMNPKLLLSMSLHTHSVLTAVYTVKSLTHTLKVIKAPYTLPV